jgi:uncharacterized protein (TIGR02246 family)
MIRRLALTLSLAVTSGAFAVTLATQPAGNRAEIDAFYGAWMGGAAQKGPAAYASFYAEDGMMLPPNERPVAGRSSIEAFQRRSQAESPYAVKPTGITVDEVRFLDNDWVVYRGTLSGMRVMKADNSSTPFETKYFDVLHRGAGGRWQVAYRMWSDNLE